VFLFGAGCWLPLPFDELTITVLARLSNQLGTLSCGEAQWTNKVRPLGFKLVWAQFSYLLQAFYAFAQ